ncbi:MAG TPA: hypothetical protein VGA40_02895 [Candidatus Acidoferrales bacterium]
MIRNRWQAMTLAGVLAVSMAAAGCARDADAEAGEKKSGGLFGMFASTRPVNVPQGTAISVTLDHAIVSNQHQSGDSFEATLAAPVAVNGVTVIPKGARVTGRVIEARESGRLKGVALLRLALDEIEVNGKDYEVQTSSLSYSGGDHKKRNWVLIGGGTGAGAAIGAAAGGGKGALIGSAIGAGAGTTAAAATGKKDIALPAESRHSFKLTQPVTVQVKE